MSGKQTSARKIGDQYVTLTENVKSRILDREGAWEIYFVCVLPVLIAGSALVFPALKKTAAVMLFVYSVLGTVSIFWVYAPPALFLLLPERPKRR